MAKALAIVHAAVTALLLVEFINMRVDIAELREQAATMKGIVQAHAETLMCAGLFDTSLQEVLSYPCSPVQRVY